METGNSGVSVAFIVFLFYFCSDFGAAVDTITVSGSIRDNETIISNGSAFKLGFFSPVNSSNRYVGIRYNDASEAVIWVANRNKPLNDASGVVTISDDGNLVVLNGQREVLWTSNVSNSVANASAQLLDSGNLVLYDNSNGSIWESFEEPINTFMRRMKLTTNVRTGEKVLLTSWKSPSDPSIGSFLAGLDVLNIPQVFVWNNDVPYWRSGQWNGREFIGITNISSVYLGGFELVENDEEGTATLSYEFAIDPTTYFVLDTDGSLLQRDRADGKAEWHIRQRYPENVCDVYGTCGEFGICAPRNDPICSCLRGFEPKNIGEWSRGNWTSGCVRRTPLQCESINKTGDASKEDGFLKYGMMKLPDFAERRSAPEDECRELCLSNCSCIAYAYDVGVGCMTWRDNLTDVQQFYSKGTDFYSRVAHSELGKVEYFLNPFAILNFNLYNTGGWQNVKAWKLWNENNIIAFIDPVMSDPFFQSEILRCIHVGLLCVQEFVKDRPTMSTVISMLNSEIVDLPTPKQPAFIEGQNALETESSEKSLRKYSVNHVSITVVDAR
ncbi:hypothetical protein JRO89_XS06G0090900 [Xanthoceras sorbifolium]|uniref:Uncharacterized protein n=1 Tax=Xanthoceras sorbifolium TaxID=99658 RepID=A0ABQ8HXE3_9ROSI|nr:hypothetical protein JRO89_XS06G0090900 [Xanthoceras sorbifolium]